MKFGRRSPKLAAVIDVGSHAARLEIFELGDAGRPAPVESLSRAIELGREVFRSGEVPPGETGMLCDIMADYRRKIGEYGEIPVRVFATGALREAANRDLVADRMFRAVGTLPEVLESSRECYLFAAASREALAASENGAPARAAAAHIGAGSLFLLGFEDGRLRFGEELPIGRDRLAGIPEDVSQLAGIAAAGLAASGALRRLAASLSGPPECLLAAGEGARRIAAFAESGSGRVREFTPGEFRDRAAAEHGTGAAETGGITDQMLKVFSCTRIVVPDFTTRSILLENADAAFADAFADDLAAVADAFVRRFAADPGRAERTAKLAAELWKKLKTRHALPPRSLPLLDAAARLYDIGCCLSGSDDGRFADFIINAASLPGVADAERRLVAAAVRFGRANGGTGCAFAEEVEKEFRPALFHMAAILRVAAAPTVAEECGKDARFNICGSELVITPAAAASGAARAELARSSELFVRVFGLTPRLGEAAL